MRLSSFEVNTTNGILLALMVPSFGVLNCHTLSNSINRASATSSKRGREGRFRPSE
jgi:hypothetical protein